MNEPTAHTTCMVLSEHLSNHYLGPLVRGAMAAAAAQRMRLILYSPLNIYMTRREFTLSEFPLLPRRVDSVVAPAHIADDVVNLIRATGATLLLYAGARSGIAQIGPDNQAGGYAATTHLIGHGRRRIVHLAGLPDSSEAGERLAGYRAALMDAGIPYDPSLVLSGCFRVQESEDAIVQYLNAGGDCDAIFAANDLSARGAMHALESAGRRIPADVALIGFDDAAGSELLDPPLTSVRQSAFQIGWEALTTLAHLGDRPLPPRIDTQVKLVVRRSCGCDVQDARAEHSLAAIAERFGFGQGPLVDAADVAAWMAPLDTALARGDLGMAINEAMQRVERHGAHAPAIRDYLDYWYASRANDGGDAERIVAAAKDALAGLLEARAIREQQERNSRLSAITEVLDLLREYQAEQTMEPVLRYVSDSGPAAAISAQSSFPDTIYAQRVIHGNVQPWQGALAAFPPPSWPAPGETMLLVPVESGAQRTVLGVIERDGQEHIALDDQLLRAINSYRSITMLNATRRELDAARSVQLSLLPRQAPISEQYDIAGATRAARQVGGDLYGYYVRDGDSLALAVGDMAGKGMPAALLMSACATALAGTIQGGLSPGRTLTQIHRLLQPSVGHGQNAAICLVYLDGPWVRIANAGAIAPMLCEQDDVRPVNVGGLPLGTALSGLQPYAEVELRLNPGDMLVLSSDGIVEAMNEAGELYGFERFADAIRRGPRDSAQQMLAHLFAEVAAFSGEAEVHDDMAIVVARYHGE